jgi:DMSO reductase anchor subunit
MRPAFSVIFLTTLIGAAQGLALVLFGTEGVYALRGTSADAVRGFLGQGAALALVLSAGGLVASFFHLGHPERAWRTAARWRSSWLSREVIALPAFMAAVAAYGCARGLGLGGPADAGSLWLAGAVAALAFALWVCTGMIYACIRVIQQWATSLTVVNFVLMGCASGFTLAAALAAASAPALAGPLGVLALVATLAAALARLAALGRNARLPVRSTLQSATGIRHPKVVQRSQGAMGGSFSTREFFHGKPPAFLARLRVAFLVLAFAAPAALLAIGAFGTSDGARGGAFVIAFLIQFAGLLIERWFFFAQAEHPQNLYYRSVA